MDSDRQLPSEEFVCRLTDHQSRLYAYILAVCGDPRQVADVLQETNVTLWRKAADYREGTNFWAWASRVAYFEILAYRKRCRRDRLVFDDVLLGDIATEVTLEAEHLNHDLVALHRCMEKLSQTERDLIRDRYTRGTTVTRLAKVWGKSVAAISQSLYRMRGRLADCIEQERGCDNE